MKHYIAVCAAIALSAACVTSHATNIALGKSVTPNGTFGVNGWGGGVLAPFSTVTDGVVLPEFTQWDQNTVWWDENAVPGTAAPTPGSLVIDLGNSCWITDLMVQADNNDTYRIEYWDGSSWMTAWDVGALSGYGMMTRATSLAAPINTSALRFSATGGDGYYSVSEIQAEGRCVPEASSTLPLLAAVLAGVGALSRRFRR